MAESALTVELSADIKNFTAAMTQATSQLGRIATSARSTQTAISGMESSMRLAAAGVAAFVGGQVLSGINNLKNSFIEMVEGPQNLQASFKALLGDGDRAAGMLARVYQTAKTTGVAFKETAEITQKMTVGLKDMGASNAQIQSITETLLKLGTVGGSSIEDTAGAALQLSQALGSGKLQGDELRSIMERMPLLGQAIAKEMGVPVGQLKALGAEGKITSDIIANSLLKSAQNVDELFKQMPLTVGRAMNNIKTAFTEGFDTSAARAAVSGLAQSLNELSGFAKNFASGLVSMVNDFRELYNSSAALRAGLEGAAIGVGVLLAAFLPIPTAIAAVTAGIVVLIANWDKVKVYFSAELIPAFQKFLAEFTLQMDLMIAMVKDKISPIITEFGRLKALWADVTAGFAGAGKETIGAVTAMGNATDYVAEANRKYSDSIKAINEEQTKLRAASRERIEDLDRTSAAAEKTSSEMGKLNATVAETGKKGGGNSLKTWVNNLLNSADAARKMQQDIDKLNEALKKGIITQAEYAKGLDKIKANFDKASAGGKSMSQEMSQFASNAMNGFFDAIASGKSFGDVLKNLALDIAKLMFQMLVVKPLLGSLFGGGKSVMGDGFSRGFGSGRLAISLPGGTDGDYSGFRAQPIPSLRSVLGSGSTGGTGDVNVGNISINVTPDGASSSGDTDTGKALGDRIKQAVLMTLVQEKRPGGILAGAR